MIAPEFCGTMMFPDAPLNSRPLGEMVSGEALMLMMVTAHGSVGATLGMFATRLTPLKANTVPASPAVTR